MTISEREASLKIECWNKAILTLGTSYVFSLRVKRFGNRLRLVNILGLVIPFFIGTIAVTYGADSDILVVILFVAGPFGIAQALLSFVALFYKWDDQVSYSLESQTDNRMLSDEFKKLAKFSPAELGEFERRFELLVTRESARTNQDDKYSFSEQENRKGMRHGLMIFDRACVGCGNTPKSMQPSNCSICGNF